MLIHFAFSFFCSIIFAFIITYLLKRKGPGPHNGLLYFFGIIFLFTAALGLFLTPIGPTYKKVPWLSIIAVALLITLLIAELLPHHEKAVIVKRSQKEEEELEEHRLEIEFGVIIGIILVMLIGGIIYAVMSPPDTFKMAPFGT